jgi:hypothetical protein
MALPFAPILLSRLVVDGQIISAFPDRNPLNADKASRVKFPKSQLFFLGANQFARALKGSVDVPYLEVTQEKTKRAGLIQSLHRLGPNSLILGTKLMAGPLQVVTQRE